MNPIKSAFVAMAIAAILAASCGQNPVYPVYAADPSAGGQGVAPLAGFGVRTVTVTGESDVKVVPDEVVISLGVETQDMDIPQAKARNDEIVKKVFKIAADHGVGKEKVRTDFMNIAPVYVYERSAQVFKGYRVQQNIAITLGDLSRYESLVTTLLEAGVNNIYGVSFNTTELRKHRDQARALAIRAAKEKAEALAGELGQSLGVPLSIVENQTSSANPYTRGMASQNVMVDAMSGEGGATDTIAPGQLSVKAQVTVSFGLK